jgi:4-aminobutyrate aminotransferase-like enzyme
MLGIDIDTEARPVLEIAAMRTSAGSGRAENPGNLENPGLLILSGGTNTLRFLPPYIISDAEIDQGLEILKEALGS